MTQEMIVLKTMNSIPVSAYKSNGFIGSYQELVRREMIPYQYRVMRDEAGTEKSGVFSNFINAGKALRGEEHGDFYGMVFQDSDAGKWLEAVAYSLAATPDETLEKQADELIDLIAAAQDADGYLDTRFTISDRDKRWTNLLEAHELYCAGHLIEAACAYCEATGKRRLLDVMLRCVGHIYRRFIKDGKPGFPGHPEIELALMKMYRITSDSRCLELAEHFINIRGQDPDFYKKEKAAYNWTVWGNDASDYNYQQSSRPVRRQTEAVGHAVRAVYLYTGMADLASETGDKELFKACRRLWESIVNRKLYITGGIGSTVHGEAFSVDYDLPPDTAYSETCAAIGLMFFAYRMLENEVSGEYGDVMEQVFYNTILAGIQLDGRGFFYVNPLEAVPGISGAAPTHRHTLIKRPGWYVCACCPPNAARLISSIGKYAYAENVDTVYCHLYASGDVTFESGARLCCKTDYPYDLTVSYKVSGIKTLSLRIPHWSKKTEFFINDEPVSPVIKNGYAYIPVSDEDEIRLVLDGTPRFVFPSERIHSVSAKTALCMGPLVYCFEGADNSDVISSCVDTKAEISQAAPDKKLPNGVIRLAVKGYIREHQERLYSCEPPRMKHCDLIAIPYSLWGNRGENAMRVWMDRA